MSTFRMLGVAAIAAAALMACAGTASATTVTSPSGTTYTSTFAMTSTHGSLHGSFITTTCTHSVFEGKVEAHGASVTARGKISKLTFTGCNYPLTVKTPGSLEFHGTGGGNGTLTWTGAEFAIHTSIGECLFTTSGTHIGTVTGGTPAKLDIESSAIPRTGGSFFCGSSMQWTGSYTFTTPGTLLID